MLDRYEDIADGMKVPFPPSACPAVSDWMLRYILERHADTPRSQAEWPLKSKFPAGWTIDQILSAVQRTLIGPDRPPVRLGDKIRFERIVDEQLVRVQVRVDLEPPQIWNAYPVVGGQ